MGQSSVKNMFLAKEGTPVVETARARARSSPLCSPGASRAYVMHAGCPVESSSRNGFIHAAARALIKHLFTKRRVMYTPHRSFSAPSFSPREKCNANSINFSLDQTTVSFCRPQSLFPLRRVIVGSVPNRIGKGRAAGGFYQYGTRGSTRTRARYLLINS